MIQIKYSADVYEAIQEIANTSGNEQQALIGEYMSQSNLFIDICKWALNPFITYGVKRLPEFDYLGSAPFDFQTYDLLRALRDRDLTGNAAQAAIKEELERLDPMSAQLLCRVITKDLRASFSAKSLNRHQPGTIFIFECMLSHKFEEKRVKSWPVAVEPKLDGVRCLAIVIDQKAKFFSRTGKEFLNYGPIGDSLVALAKEKGLAAHDMIFDGEMMDGEFNNTVGSAHRKDEVATSAVYHVFEAMTLAAFDGGSSHTYTQRRAAVDRIFTGSDYANLRSTESRLLNSVEEIMQWNSELQAAGGEGVIVKPLTGTYAKKRSHDWLKVKACDSADLKIVGAFEGEGKYVGKLGGLIVDFNGVLVNVGSGLTDADRETLWARAVADDLVLSDFTNVWPVGAKGELYGHLIEVAYHEVTPDGSLRHPRFIRFRDDKHPEDGDGVQLAA